MPCYFPIRGWRGRTKNPSGKFPIVFKLQHGWADQEVMIPCGRCIGCRLERSRQWAIRCMHEAECYENNCFITLTYNDTHLPPGGSLVMADFQKFMKRLRKRFEPLEIRFFHCGEYGENTNRPHYHACLFNLDFPDKNLLRSHNGNRYYTSSILSELWPYGHHIIGDVTFDSAAYVARYIMKKVNGPLADKQNSLGLTHYERITPDGEIIKLHPEYTTMSRRPGIGKTFFKNYQSDIYPSDSVVVNGLQMNPPKFYDNLLDKHNPQLLLTLKRRRKLKQKLKASDNTLRRLQDRLICKQQKIKLLPRRLEND